MNIIILLISLFFFHEVIASSSQVLKLSCKYNPTLITKEQQDIELSENIDRLKICKSFRCKDTVEIIKKDLQPKGQEEYLLRNSWFNHQGILIDKFSKTKEKLIINTFVSQANYAESYIINRLTGKTKRTFYKFDSSKFLDAINKSKFGKNTISALYNNKGKISLKTLKLFSIEPNETFHFEGLCLEGEEI